MERKMRRRYRSAAWNAGYSLVELLAVIALLGLLLAVTGAAWSNYRRAANSNSSAYMIKMAVHQARILSIYRNVNHFVVLDPENQILRIVEDTSSPIGGYDAGDNVIQIEQWPATVHLALPAEPDPLTDPQTGANLTDAWSLPAPDTSAAWGTTLRGVMTTPQGQIMSAEATPATIGLGVAVFSDNQNITVAVGMDGLAGGVRAWRLREGTWEEL
jgi:prepilin-type N-terminal cleavage/methylation domain-containing protein